MRTFASNLFALALLAGPFAAFGQEPPAELAGTYIGSQMEIGTGLRLEPDGHFRYYLSYGALDETAEGTWTASDAGIILTSAPITAPAFELLGTDDEAGSTFSLSIEPTGSAISAQYFEAIVHDSDGDVSQTQFTDDGLSLTFPPGKSPTAVVLVLPVFDLSSQAFPVPPGAKAMRFRFAANDLGKVAFDHELLRREGDAFLLDRFGRTLRYRMERQWNADNLDEAAEKQP